MPREQETVVSGRLFSFSAVGGARSFVAPRCPLGPGFPPCSR